MVNRIVLFWLIVGGVGYLLLPWYAIEDGIWTLEWLFDGYPTNVDYAPALFQISSHGKLWLVPLGIALLPPLLVLNRKYKDAFYANTLIISGLSGLLWFLIQGFAISYDGWNFAFLENWFGLLTLNQLGMGYGALFTATAFLFFLMAGIAAKGAVNGDVFIVCSIGFVISLVGTFVFFPVLGILTNALQDQEGLYSLFAFFERFFNQDTWGVACLTSNRNCGVAWNSVILALATGLTTTFLGLAYALVVTRTNFRAKKLLRMLTVIPIITPPFVIGLAIILLFGRAGTITQFMYWAFDLPESRWIYGFLGILLAQTLSFAPIAFLVLIGVVEGASPSMEEAAQTLGANQWRTFWTVTFPLIRPGIANAFLLGFIESMADFGNPLVLGGNFDVLSTKIFFAVVGAQNDPGKAAALAIVLLIFTLAAFYAQRRWLGKKSYTTVTGKADTGIHPPLPKGLERIIYGITLPWAAFTLIIYVMILFGGFVETWGRDHSFTLKHYLTAFAVTQGEHGLVWYGSAWNSFWTTMMISGISAPLTAAIGLLVAYLLVRQTFSGKGAFEFGTLLSFAIPGTVIGISYIIAFNVPPLELTGTGVILVICFIFRNMPVGVRGGIAAMVQLDKSLDEASLVLGGNSFLTLRRVILPLLRPAIIAALVYSFVRSITAISAVIFLVSADYDMATSYIIGRVENADYGEAIAYSSMLIVVMLVVILLFQAVVGERRLGRKGLHLT